MGARPAVIRRHVCGNKGCTLGASHSMLIADTGARSAQRKGRTAHERMHIDSRLCQGRPPDHHLHDTITLSHVAYASRCRRDHAAANTRCVVVSHRSINAHGNSSQRCTAQCAPESGLANCAPGRPLRPPGSARNGCTGTLYYQNALASRGQSRSNPNRSNPTRARKDWTRK